MYKLLIAEDETLFSDFIKDSIEWSEIGIEVLGVYTNGEVALKAIAEQKPDVVLADINMPKMNGLEMIKKVKEQGVDANFVVISGYDDFHLVKEGFKLGIVDYILKSELDPENLKAIVKRTLDNKKSSSDGYRSDQKLLFKEQYLKGLIWGAKTFRDKGKELSLRIEESGLCVLVLNILNFDVILEQEWEKESELLKYGMINMLEELLEIQDCGEMVIKQDSEVVFLFSFPERQNSADKCAGVEGMADYIMQKLHQYFGFEMAAGYFGFTDNAAELRNLYEKAKLAAAYTFIAGRDRKVFYSEELQKPEENFSEERAARFEKRIFEFDFEKLLEELENFTLKSVSVCQLEELKTLYKSYFSAICKLLKKYPKPAFSPEKYKEILQTGTLAELNTLLQVTLQQLKAAFKEEDGIVLKIQKYIRRNYYKNVTIEDIAKEFEVDCKKMSRKFQKQTGTSVKKYIIEIRMEEAMHLITTTDYFLYEIAEMVGYPNYESFSRSFYGYFGKWPKAIARE